MGSYTASEVKPTPFYGFPFRTKPIHPSSNPTLFQAIIDQHRAGFLHISLLTPCIRNEPTLSSENGVRFRVGFVAPDGRLLTAGATLAVDRQALLLDEEDPNQFLTTSTPFFSHKRMIISKQRAVYDHGHHPFTS